MVVTRRTTGTTKTRHRGSQATKPHAPVLSTADQETRRIVRKLIKRYRRALSRLDEPT